MKIGFDSAKYISLQSEQIKKRIASFGGKLYLEFGGKLFDDFHASRVLPGFNADNKIKMLMELKDECEMVIVVNSFDIEKNKVRGDLGITYDLDTLRLIDAFRACGLFVGSVVLTHYAGQEAANAFAKRLEALGVKTYRHYIIEGYPQNVERIVSDEGFGKNDYIETSHELVVVTAPGPGSGKMATCLSQLYHENKRGIKAGYAKFETFPIWNLPLRHPVNIAYEAATADLKDVNMIDPFHLEAYGVTTVNYNRDVEIFPVLNAIFTQIFGSSVYRSPTDMGVNMAGYCITDDKVCCEASYNEIVRRYYDARCNLRKGLAEEDVVFKIELLMKQCGITPEYRRVASYATERAAQTGMPAAAIELPDGHIITGKTSSLLGASSAMLLNALKYLAGIPDDVLLMQPSVIEPTRELKTLYLRNSNPRLHLDEILIALAICATTDPNARRAIDCLCGLAGSEMHSSVILSEVDVKLIKKLGINLTCEPVYQTKKLYHK